MWGKTKVKNGHGKYFDEWGERDLRDMIRRDRNHPSVVMWSIGNEILEQADADGWKVAKRLTDICHEEDPTRPVTAGFNQAENAIKNRLAEQVDIPGFNYGVRQYAKILADHPGWTIVGAETASCVSSRGVYHLPIEKYEKHPSLQLTSYDVIAPPWAYCPDVEFAGLEASPQVLGEFVWTGFDYLGEPTPYFAWDQPRTRRTGPRAAPTSASWTSPGSRRTASTSTRASGRRSRWCTCCPHWNWAGLEGQPIPVMAYTNAEEVELFLNGRSLGRKKKGEPYVIPVGKKISEDLRFTTKYRVVWEVPYAPGTLTAVAFAGGQTVASTEVRTAGAPARVVLVPGPDDPPRRRRGPVVRHGAHRGRGRQPRAGRRQPGALRGARAPGASPRWTTATRPAWSRSRRRSARRSPASRSSSCARTAECRARSASRPRRTASPRPGPSSGRSEGRGSERDEVRDLHRVAAVHALAGGDAGEAGHRTRARAREAHVGRKVDAPEDRGPGERRPRPRARPRPSAGRSSSAHRSCGRRASPSPPGRSRAGARSRAPRGGPRCR